MKRAQRNTQPVLQRYRIIVRESFPSNLHKRIVALHAYAILRSGQRREVFLSKTGDQQISKE